MPEERGIDLVQRQVRVAAFIGLSSALAALVWLSWHLAHVRIYQVDECQNLFVATLLANGLGDLFMTSVSLYLVPMMFLADDFTHSAELFSDGRLMAFALFWINILLLAAATGERLRSIRGLTVLGAAAMLAPLWDYGFEVRHDNLLLTTLLLIWLFGRVWTWGRPSLFLIGVLSIVGELVAFKAFVYTIPLTFLAVLGPAPSNGGTRVPRLSSALAWIVGAAAAALAFRALYGWLGVWNIYARDVTNIFSLAAGADRFTPIPTLLRVVQQTPLLVVVAAIGCGYMARGVRTDWPRIRHTLAPEAMLVLIALVALAINPAPHPYNLVNVVPFVFLFCYRSVKFALEKTRRQTVSTSIAVSIILTVAHVQPFAAATVRHLSMTNDRQRTLMATAEALTDPDNDLVYDGIGMVPARRSISRDWLIHGWLLETLLSSPASSVRQMLHQNPPSVLIQSYRTDWLTAEDHAFIQSRYVPLSDELWVLGKTFPRGGGSFEVVQTGRYVVVLSTDAPQAVADAEPAGSEATVDGKPVIDGIVYLTEGRHSVEVPAETLPTVVWIGPTLRQLPRLGPGDHRRLFVNWY